MLPEVGSRIVWPGRISALVLGVLDQRPSHPVLDRAGRVVGLELGPDPDARLRAQSLELDQRRVPDRLDDVAIPAPAGLVLKALDRHRFTKCSDGRWPARTVSRRSVQAHGPRAAGGLAARARRRGRRAPEFVRLVSRAGTGRESWPVLVPRGRGRSCAGRVRALLRGRGLHARARSRRTTRCPHPCVLPFVLVVELERVQRMAAERDLEEPAAMPEPELALDPGRRGHLRLRGRDGHREPEAQAAVRALAERVVRASLRSGHRRSGP